MYSSSFCKCENPIRLGFHNVVPCGHCSTCLRKAKNEWRTRLQAEMRTYKNNACFMTLTFSDVDNQDTSYRSIQLFLKRLRKFYKERKIKYFGCFEKGEKTERSHYHIIIFGVYPHPLHFAKYDDKYCKTSNEFVAKYLWQNGQVCIEPCNDSTISYVSQYVAKKYEIQKNKVDRYINKWAKNDFQILLSSCHEAMPKRQSFYFMSKGLGFKWLLAHIEQVIRIKAISFKGRFFAIPRAFIKKIRELVDDDFLRVNIFSEYDERFTRFCDKHNLELCFDNLMTFIDMLRKNFENDILIRKARANDFHQRRLLLCPPEPIPF